MLCYERVRQTDGHSAVPDDLQAENFLCFALFSHKVGTLCDVHILLLCFFFFFCSYCVVTSQTITKKQKP